MVRGKPLALRSHSVALRCGVCFLVRICRRNESMCFQITLGSKTGVGKRQSVSWGRRTAGSSKRLSGFARSKTKRAWLKPVWSAAMKQTIRTRPNSPVACKEMNRNEWTSGIASGEGLMGVMQHPRHWQSDIVVNGRKHEPRKIEGMAELGCRTICSLSCLHPITPAPRRAHIVCPNCRHPANVGYIIFVEPACGGIFDYPVAERK